jgi:glycosyltransferase involved in cell wall biosynthesis
MSEPRGVSIIVVNYNNAEFLAAAIDSALGQTHPLCEVIVVDDCSTDNSSALISHYSDRVRIILREQNGGQTAALNSAWPLAHYPILIFLDSDDVLLPHAAATVASRWAAGTVKTQSPLITIDKYPRNLDTATLRRTLLRTAGCPVSPSCGNACSRTLLEAITRDGGFNPENPREMWMDLILECNAPFYGEVVTIYEPLACYRIHDSNDNMLNSIDKARFDKMSRYYSLKLDYFTRRCRVWQIAFDPIAARNRSIWALECRLVADKLVCRRERLDDPVWLTLFRALKACIGAELPVSNRMIRVAWFIVVAVGPRFVARRLIAIRFIIEKRPTWVEPILRKIANISGWRGSSKRGDLSMTLRGKIEEQLDNKGEAPKICLI